MNTRINRNATVHATNGTTSGSICSAEGAYGFRPSYRPTTDAVTCKRCLKMAAAEQSFTEEIREAVEAVTEAPAGHISCDECGKHIRFNMKAMNAHAADCF